MTVTWEPEGPPTSPPRLPVPSRRDLEGPTRADLEGMATYLAGTLHMQAHTRPRWERRLEVLRLLHEDPQLLVETVLALADETLLGRAHGR